MKIKRIAAIVVAASMVFLLAACGKAEDIDAKEYVQSCLDAKYKGEFEAYAKNVGVSVEEAKEQVTGEFNDSLAKEVAATGLVATEEDIARYQQMESDLRKQVKYTVKDAVKDEDDNFTVDVEVTPIDAYSELNANFETKLTEAVQNGAQESEFLGIFLDCQEESIKNAKELEPTTVTLHITHEDKDGEIAYSIDEDDVMSFEVTSTGMQ